MATVDWTARKEARDLAVFEAAREQFRQDKEERRKMKSLAEMQRRSEERGAAQHPADPRFRPVDHEPVRPAEDVVPVDLDDLLG